MKVLGAISVFLTAIGLSFTRSGLLTLGVSSVMRNGLRVGRSCCSWRTCSDTTTTFTGDSIWTRRRGHQARVTGQLRNWRAI